MNAKGIISRLLVIVVAITLGIPTNGKTAEAVEATTAETAVVAKASPPNMKKAVKDGGLALAAENDRLLLYFDNESGGVAVEDKETGSKFYSNPPSALEDPKASDAMKQELMSQVKLVYNVQGKEGDLEMNSYTHAMKLDQVSWGKIDNGIRVDMVIGREEQRMLLPRQITKSKFEQNVLDHMEADRDKKKLLAYYILYSRADVEGSKGKELIAKYPVLEKEDIYVLKTSVKERDKKVLENYVKEAGYTYEKQEEDYAEVGYDGDDSVFPYFKMSLDYVLADGGLSVTLYNGNIEYDQSRFNLVKLSLLNYFGAGQTGEEGYVFLPDGSGTLLNFNNDASKNTLLTTGKMYGPDYALTQSPRGSFKQEFRAPVFGIKKDGAALFSVIEEGDAVADINGVMGGINHSYNTAYANFTIRNKDSFIAKNAFEQAPWIIYEKNAYTGNIVMKYFFLTGDDANYVGMAKAYRQYLVDKGSLSKMSAEENIPFYLDTMGSVDKMVRKLGIPFRSQVAVTSFDQAGLMLDELSQSGIQNIKFRYTGWYNGGMSHTAPTKMKVESVLGGAKGLRKLSEKAEKLGAKVFPDVDMLFVSSNKAFDGFKPQKDSIRSLFQKTSYKGLFNVATLEYESSVWGINPDKISGYYNKFSKDYHSLGLKALSLSTMGESLNSNFKNRAQINRQDTKKITTDVLAKAKEDYEDIITDDGNAYTFPYVNHILNLPDEDSSFSIADAQVPFIQIALHGYIGYASEALNLASELRPAVLKALEYGSGVYFKLNYGENSLLKDASLFDDLYASQFDDWEESAAAIYAEMNNVLKHVQDQAIVNHERLGEEVYKTTYENGKAIIVNYSDKGIEVEGTAVDGLGYAVINP